MTHPQVMITRQYREGDTSKCVKVLKHTIAMWQPLPDCYKWQIAKDENDNVILIATNKGE